MSETPEFSTWLDYPTFAAEVVSHQRFFRSEHCDKFCDAVAASAHRRETRMPAGTELWRAQKDCEESQDQVGNIVYAPHPPARMKPFSDKAWEGRVNPKGIPCLYTATKPDTAVAEVRCGIGERVTVANLRTTRELRLVSCIEHGTAAAYFGQPDAATKEREVWHAMNAAFSEPVGRQDDRADYAPTQVLAELFKSIGFDGIVYRSGFGTSGLNAALFSLDSAEIMGRWVYRVDDVSVRVSAIPGTARPELGAKPFEGPEWFP